MQPYATGCNWQMQLAQPMLRGQSRVVVTLLPQIFPKQLMTCPSPLLPMFRLARSSIHHTTLPNPKLSNKVLCCGTQKFLSILLTSLTLSNKFFWTTSLSMALAHPLKTIDSVTILNYTTHLSNLETQCPTMTFRTKCPTMTIYPKHCVFQL